jgi:hypothetical protein
MMSRRLLRPFVVLIEALLITWALLFLAGQFGWSAVREAGGAMSATDGGPTL